MEKNKKIKFVHCADIHLGANPFGIIERFEDMGRAFEQVCDFALKEKVDFVLISGDFFHDKVLNPKTLEQAINILEKLKNKEIPVFLTEGNHDMETYSNVYSWLQFLSKKKYIILLRPNKKEDILKLWDGQVGSIYKTEFVDIIGLGYPGSTALKYIERANTELNNLIEKKIIGVNPIICMLHTGINKFVTESMGGLKENEIDSFLQKIDYLALGHIHTRYENIDKRYYNPGSVECVRMTDNPFNKGFYYVLLDTKTRKIETEFKMVEARNSLSLEININEKKDDDECEEYILETVKKQYMQKCIGNSRIMLQIKIIGMSIKGKNDINIVNLKEKIKKSVPILHQEIINLIRYVDEKDKIIINDVPRDEIDKIVIKNKIENMGFKKEEIDKVYSVIEKLKEYGQKEAIDIESSYGQDLEKMLFELFDTGRS